MRIMGHIQRTAFAAFFLFLSTAPAARSSEKPAVQAAVRRPTRLSELAILVNLKAADEDRRDGSIVITNNSVARHDEKGMLTVAGSTAERPDTISNEGDLTSTSDEVAKLRQSWRKKVDAQRKRIARTEHEIVVQEGKINALTNAAFDAGHSSRKAINAWARIETEKSRLAAVEARLKQEKQALNRIVREARRDGAQPGWFR